MTDLAFYILSGIALAGALAAVLHRQLVLAALNLVLMMLALAGIFLLLSAPFLAAMQVIVYSGAIMVLFIFSIMLLNAPEDRSGDAVSRSRKLAAGLAGILFFFALARATLGQPQLAAHLGWAENFGTPANVSGALLKMAIPFEIVSLLLTVAMLAAVVLAKRRLPGADEDVAEFAAASPADAVTNSGADAAVKTAGNAP